jgi:hypothetical protein
MTTPSRKKSLFSMLKALFKHPLRDLFPIF